MNDYIIRAIAANDQIRAFAAVTTAPATSSFPLLFAGIHTSGFPTYPFTRPLESAVTVIPSRGPPALI